MSTFTTTANLAKILKTITGAAGRDSTLPMLQTIHAARVGDDTLRLTATDRFLLARIDVRGDWVGGDTAEIPAEGVKIPVDAAKRVGQLFATAKPSHAHVGTGILTRFTVDASRATVEVIGTRAHDGTHALDLVTEYDFPKVDGIIRSVPQGMAAGGGVRVNPTFLKNATTILQLCDRPHTAEVYPTGDERKPLALHGLMGAGGEAGEVLVYLMVVRSDIPIDPSATAARLTGER